MDFAFVKAAPKNFYVDGGQDPPGPGTHVKGDLSAVVLPAGLGFIQGFH